MCSLVDFRSKCKQLAKNGDQTKVGVPLPPSLINWERIQGGVTNFLGTSVFCEFLIFDGKGKRKGRIGDNSHFFNTSNLKYVSLHSHTNRYVYNCN